MIPEVERMTDLCVRLERDGIAYEEHCPLSPRGSFRIGGTAALAVFPQSREQLIRSLLLTRDAGCPYAVVGKGSNLLYPDGEYAGTVIFTGGVRELRVCGTGITASAGLSLPALALRARDAALTGLEFAAGIPGTLGGAVFMNAGAFGGCMEQVVLRSEFWDARDGCCGCLEGGAQEFSVRSSIYMREARYTILGAVLELREGNREEIGSRMEDYRRRRSAAQPLGLPNAGSIFRHPPGHFAGRLIEDCGLKGVCVGGAAVSEKHAGFIVNRGGATAHDVLALIDLIRERVLRQTGIALECELRRLDGRPI